MAGDLVAESERPSDQSAGELMSRFSKDISTLIRDELRLAQAETTAKAKRLGLGAGLFGGAGLVAVFGIGALVAAAILGLATVVDAWLAAIIVGVALFAVAGLLALVGKKDVQAGSPPVPTEAIDGVKSDIHAIKNGTHA
jgi:Putative Actinobacterial Holin-X, holin superfamily III